VTFNDLLGNRKPKTCAGSGFAPRRIDPEKRLEYARHVVLWNARAFVINCDQSGSVLQPDTNKRTAAMGCCVDNEIPDRPRQRQWRRRNCHRLHFQDRYGRLHFSEILADLADDFIDPE
jgi:hypothetical protein